MQFWMLSRDGPGNVLYGGVDAHALPTSSIKALKAIFSHYRNTNCTVQCMNTCLPCNMALIIPHLKQKQHGNHRLHFAHAVHSHHPLPAKGDAAYRQHAMDIGNMHKKFGKDRTCGSGDILADRQTDTQTDLLITILRNHCRGQSNKV